MKAISNRSFFTPGDVQPLQIFYFAKKLFFWYHNLTMKKKNLVFIILVILSGLNFLAWSVVYDLNQPGFLEVIFFDVGQGDAALIKSGQGHYILIDGGPDSKILEKLSEEIPVWRKEIDLIFLTHGHSDHYSGLMDVVKRYDVENILWNGVIEESAGFAEWKNSALDSKAEIRVAFAGQRIRGKDFFIDVLHPFFSLEGMEFKDANLPSLILRLVFNRTSFLFTGDAYQSVEKQLIEQVEQIESDVLKVGHHGSKTSTAEEFVKIVMPEIAIISCGENNRFGHPHFETLETLAKYGINVLRTDQTGDIKIISDGEKLIIKN